MPVDDRDELLIGLAGRLHRLTPAVVDMTERLPPGERHQLLADWRCHLRDRQALVRALLAEAGPTPSARRLLEQDLVQGATTLRRLGQQIRAGRP